MRIYIILFFSITYVIPQSLEYSNGVLPFIFLNNIEAYDDRENISDSSFVFTNLNYNQIYLEKRGSNTQKDFGYWISESGINTSISLFNQSYNILSSIERNNKYIISKENGEELQYNQIFNKYKLLIRTPEYFNLVVFQSILYSNSFSDLDYSLKIFLQLLNRVKIYFGSAKHVNEGLVKSVNSNGEIDIIYFDEKRIFNFDIKLMINENVSLSANYNKADLNSDKNPGANKHILIPVGGEDFYTCNGTAKDVGFVDQIDVSYKHFNSISDGYFYSDKSKFGKITRKNSELDQYSIGLSKKFNLQEIQTCFSAGNGNIHVSGSMDTWPFTEYWVGFLGLRNFLDTEFKYRYISGNLIYQKQFNLNSYWQLGIGYEFFNVDDLSKIKTWQSEIIIPRNFYTANYGFKDQHGIYLNPKISYEISTNIRVNYQLNQYIPISRGSSSQSSHSASANKTFKYGGGRHLFQLQIGI